MPSLRAFNRQWNIASDDFVFPGISEACIRLSWFFFGVGVFVFHFPLQCSTQNLRIYFEGLILVNGITAILALVTAVLSARGTIINSRKRRHVTTMLYIRLPIFIFEILWNGVCTFVAFQSIGEAKGCHFVTITRVAVVLEWLLILTVFVIIIVVFHGNNDNMENADQFARRVWMRRFKIFKIRQDALMRAAIDDLANLFASFFYDTDLVMSDVAAGLLLVVHSPTNVYPPLVPAQSGIHHALFTIHDITHLQMIIVTG
ncbi:hypothetical protein WR25_20519 [Diploscapter pachys]|uniref:Uncharacterized protein n=1 Tax=Diploscapter pachys TaxID=2018661 RepID=A0A2A2KCG3_9BILA|nr:hypothetical protein WR25_20519 [Diploscapter pachys]